MAESIHNDRWYIEVKGQVIGAAPTWGIIQRLMSGQLKVIHRISRDRSQWKAICNEEYIEQAIHAVIQALGNEAKQYSPEDPDKTEAIEQSGFHNIKNLKTGINEQLQHAERLQEINVMVTSLRKLLAEIIAKRKLVIDGKVEDAEELHPDDRNVYLHEGRKWYHWDWNSKYAKILIYTAAGLTAIWVGVAKYDEFVERQEQRQAEVAAREALRQKSLGNYDRAINAFRDVKDYSKLDPHTLLEMAEVHIRSGNIKDGRDLISFVFNAQATAREKARAHGLLGVIALKSNNLEAAKSAFRSSLEEENLYSSLHNMGVLYLKQKEYLLAEDFLLKALAMPDVDKGPTLLALYETALAMDTAVDPGLRAAGDNPEIETFPRLRKLAVLMAQPEYQSKSFGTEILAARAVIALTVKSELEVETATRRFVAVDPGVPTEKNYLFDLNYEHAAWSNIYEWCKAVHKVDYTNVLKNALLAGCIVRAVSPKAGLPYAYYAHSARPSDKAMRDLYARMLVLDGSVDKAKAVIPGDEFCTVAPYARICREPAGGGGAGAGAGVGPVANAAGGAAKVQGAAPKAGSTKLKDPQKTAEK